LLECKAIIPGRLGVFVARSPITVEHVLATQYAIVAGEREGLSLDTPSILDFTGVSVSDITAPELMRFIRHRRAMVEAPTTGPLAFVCGNTALFGMLRMFSILAEVGGLWAENMIQITKDPDKALDWIAQRAGLEEAEVEVAAVELRRITGWPLASFART